MGACIRNRIFIRIARKLTISVFSVQGSFNKNFLRLQGCGCACEGCLMNSTRYVSISLQQQNPLVEKTPIGVLSGVGIYKCSQK